jgi:hypothetical protein
MNGSHDHHSVSVLTHDRPRAQEKLHTEATEGKLLAAREPDNRQKK